MKDIIKNKKGFTLVELLAVIVVLAIIILVAMPNVMSAMEKHVKMPSILKQQKYVKLLKMHTIQIF